MDECKALPCAHWRWQQAHFRCLEVFDAFQLCCLLQSAIQAYGNTEQIPTHRYRTFSLLLMFWTPAMQLVLLRKVVLWGDPKTIQALGNLNKTPEPVQPHCTVFEKAFGGSVRCLPYTQP